MNCWIDKVCEKPNDCDCNCLMFKSLERSVNASMIPLNYRKIPTIYGVNCDIDKYKRLKEIENDIGNWVRAGSNVLMHSSACGNGKTTWACKLLLAYLIESENGDFEGCRALFINVQNLLMELRMNREYDTNKDFIVNFISKAKNADLVIWDEIGVKQLTEYEMMFLYHIIDHRMNYLKSNIYTANASPQLAEQNLYPRLYSRIYTLSEKLEFKGKDWRDAEYRKGLGIE